MYLSIDMVFIKIIRRDKPNITNHFLQTIDVAVCEQICVHPGDVIGVHYSDTDAAGVVPYEQMGRSRSGGVTLAEDDFSRLVNKDIGEDVLPVGKNMATTTAGVKRIPALRPIISNGPENE